MRQGSGMPPSENESVRDFSELNISEPLKKGIAELGYVKPTEFQKEIFNNFMLGKNIVGEGQSSYGKSLAFSLPILSKINKEESNPQALIMCESFLQADLAIKELRALGRHVGISVDNSGALEKDLTALPEILVMSYDDLEKLKNVEQLNNLRTIFFDGLTKAHTVEAINILRPLFYEEMQFLIFGNEAVEAFKDETLEMLKEAVFVNNSDQPKITKPAIHIIHQTKDDEPKPRALLAALLHHKPKGALITCNNGAEAELLGRFLMRYGYKTRFSSEEQNRHAIQENLLLLAGNKIDAFICQNNLLLGQDLKAVPFMINYDMFERPQVYEQTTQFNKQAPDLVRTIVNLLSSRELGYQGPIKAQCLIEFCDQELPTGDEVIALATQRIVALLNEEALAIELGQFEALAQSILEKKDALPAIALLLRNHFLNQGNKEPAREYQAREHSNSERRRPDRREERPRRGAPSSGDARIAKDEKEEATTRLYVTLGRQDGLLDLASLAQYLSEQSQVDLGHFSGTGMLREHSAHIEVDNDVADQIIKAIHDSARPHSSEDGVEHEKGATIVCERARKTTERRYRPQQRRGPMHQRRH